MLQGINDGFLAPYRVTADFINIDLQGWTPEEGERDLLGKEIKQKLYQRQNIGRDLAIKLRHKIVAHRITQMLHDIGRMTKTRESQKKSLHLTESVRQRLIRGFGIKPIYHAIRSLPVLEGYIEAKVHACV